MKNFLIFLGFTLCTLSFVPCYAQDMFSDVPWGYWAKGSIEQLANKGIIGGYPDGKFCPQKGISRAELAALLVRAKFGKQKNQGIRSFTDLSAKHWAATYVDKALEQEWITGFPNDTFRPKKLVSRAEGIIMLTRFDNLTTNEVLARPFPDIATKYWAARAISAAKSAGWLDYLAGQHFQPNKVFSRAEVAEILAKTSFIKEQKD